MSYNASTVGERCSLYSSHEGQTLRFMKELSVNISYANPTLESFSSLHLCWLYTGSFGVFQRWAALRTRHWLLALPRSSAQEKGQTHDISTLEVENRAGVEPILKSLLFSNLSLLHKQQQLPIPAAELSLLAFFWENSIRSGLEEDMLILFAFSIHEDSPV